MTTYNSKREAVIAALPGTVPQIAEKSGASTNTVRLWLSRLHAANECYVKGWKRTSGQMIRRYAIGNAPDKQRPARLSQKDYNRTNYLRNRRANEKASRAVRTSARESADRMAKTPNSWLAILGVRASANGEG